MLYNALKKTNVLTELEFQFFIHTHVGVGWVAASQAKRNCIHEVALMTLMRIEVFSDISPTVNGRKLGVPKVYFFK